MEDWIIRERLHFAAADGDIKQMKKLISEDYDLNAFDEDLGKTPLHYAAENNHIQAVQLLVQAGADVNANDTAKIGNTPLGEIAQTCSYEMAKILIDAGSNPTTPGWMWLTALDRAERRKKTEGRRVYDLLLKTAKEKFNYIEKINKNHLERIANDHV